MKKFAMILVLMMVMIFATSAVACPPCPEKHLKVSGKVEQAQWVMTEDNHGQGGYAYASGGNESMGKYKGEKWGCQGDLVGGAVAYGNTNLGAWTNGTTSIAGGLTTSGSCAMQNGYGTVKVKGSGELYTGTLAQDRHGNWAGTASHSTYSYNKNGYNHVSGGGATGAIGYSNVNKGPNTVSSTAFTAAGSYAH